MGLTSLMDFKLTFAAIKRCSAYLSLLIVAILSCGLATAAETDTPPFYKVTYQGKQAFILGSIHVGKADFYPMAPVIEQAFSQADALVIEADVTKADTQQLLGQYGLATPASSVDLGQAYPAFCKLNLAVCQGLSPLAPWLQAAQVALVRFSQLGFSAEEGVDVTFVAKNQGRTLLELESVAYQFELISSFSQQTQRQMLDEAVETSDEEMLEMVAAWRGGDKQKLADIMEHQSDDVAKELVEKLLWQRNQQMSQRTIALLKEGNYQQLFIIVGAGHLVGRQSMPMILKQTGAEVTDCWHAQCL
ncbi:TraB/GumN family protein [Shewanella sp. 10N.286.48.B5]|uniref:TraB/GumN family protein n=1 Tax=Shewanella sp. 10N.286.48.B5 TaxID=1880834 RepID=UPI000C81DCEA|nr:TraB/GumN family protein [Shewanella sp. 10N.286.48.B5]